MSFKNQTGILAFDEISFPKKSNLGSFILRIIRFALIIIIGFDLNVIEVENIAIGIIHFELFMKATLWMKTKIRSNGNKWIIIQTQESKFFTI